MNAAKNPAAVAFVIRPFELADYAGARQFWSTIEGLGLNESDTQEAIESFLTRNPQLSAIAMCNEIIIGTVLCGHNGRAGSMHHLAVATEHRGQGIGYALVNYAMARLAEAKISRCNIFVYNANDQGNDFWLKNGWNDPTTWRVLQKYVTTESASSNHQDALPQTLTTTIRPATPNDTAAIAAIHLAAFPRQRDSTQWVAATLAAAPRMLAYVVVHRGEIVGFAFWAQKAGIRTDSVLELDQIAVLSTHRDQGLGEKLIRDSLKLVKAELAANGQSIKSIFISTRADNGAQRLYARALGARVEAEIKDLYSATEVLMVAKVGDT
jgi:N-acetylglutamate synthase